MTTRKIIPTTPATGTCLVLPSIHSIPWTPPDTFREPKGWSLAWETVPGQEEGQSSSDPVQRVS